jgi:membrane protease YdiL (CAAX protease family)
MSLPWPDSAALVALLVLLPVLSVLQVRLLRGMEVERMPVYLGSAVSLVVLGGAAWALGSRDEGASAVGLVPLPWAAFALWSGGLVAAGVALSAAFRRAAMALGLRESGLLRSLLPRTGRERAAFAGLSVAAGVGEELAYRGYVIPVLAVLLGPVGAAVVSSVVFGVLHAYQGPLGMARTAALGGLLAWGFLASGSLWPPIAAHALLDVVLGVALAERMMVPEDPSGVRHPVPTSG